tara:strand:+ start:243 stop:521 length:279 start_codon:yes stop_codon:yes gene_type:complete
MKANKIVAVLLCLGVLSFPYGYYTLLRIIVTIAAIINAYNFLEESNMEKVYLFGFLAILFNPLIPIYLGKELWILIDLAAAGIFFFLAPQES